MRHIILFDSDIRDQLLPFTLTRPVSELRLGIFTIKEKWSRLFGEASFSHITPDHLEPLFPINIQDENLLINGAIVPDAQVYRLIVGLGINEALMFNGELMAARLPRQQFALLLENEDLNDLTGYEVGEGEIKLLQHLWEIPRLSASEIAHDMHLLSMTTGAQPGSQVSISGDFPVFIHPEARLGHVIINAEEGPVYIGKAAWVMDGSILRGPLAVGDHATVRMAAKLFGGTSIGPGCVVGGEVKNSTMLGYSNKAHEGYLGDSVVGEWCNLGALTSNSNLRNTYSNVKVWDYRQQERVDCGNFKCGVFVGDYTRTAIHSMLGAGSVIGVSCHIIGQGFCRPYVPSFTWGGVQDQQAYQLEKAVDAAMHAQSHKGRIMETAEKELLQQIFVLTAPYRQKMDVR